MMKKLAILLLLSAPCFAASTRYGPTYDSTKTNQEFEEVYSQLANPNFSVAVGSTETLNFLSVSTMTSSSGTITNLSVGTLRPTTITFPDASTLTSGKYMIVRFSSSTATGTDSTTSATFQTSSLATTISPSSSSNLIFVMAMTTGEIRSNGALLDISLFRGTTNLDSGPGTHGLVSVSGTVTSGNPINPVALIFLDGPATTSATTYALKYKTTGGATGVINDQGGGTTIYAFELKAL